MIFNLTKAKYFIPIRGSKTYASHEFARNIPVMDCEEYCGVIAEYFLQDDVKDVLYQEVFSEIRNYNTI